MKDNLTNKSLNFFRTKSKKSPIRYLSIIAIIFLCFLMITFFFNLSSFFWLNRKNFIDFINNSKSKISLSLLISLCSLYIASKNYTNDRAYFHPEKIQYDNSFEKGEGMYQIHFKVTNASIKRIIVNERKTTATFYQEYEQKFNNLMHIQNGDSFILIIPIIKESDRGGAVNGYFRTNKLITHKITTIDYKNRKTHYFYYYTVSYYFMLNEQFDYSKPQFIYNFVESNYKIFLQVKYLIRFYLYPFLHYLFGKKQVNK